VVGNNRIGIEDMGVGIRNPQGRMSASRKWGDAQVATGVTVTAEMRYGTVGKGSARLTAQVGAVFGATKVLPFEERGGRSMAVPAASGGFTPKLLS
jgi:hypothetical protein